MLNIFLFMSVLYVRSHFLSYKPLKFDILYMSIVESILTEFPVDTLPFHSVDCDNILQHTHAALKHL